MEVLIPALTLAAFATVWWWFVSRISGGRLWNPVSMAFTTTASAVVLIVTGSSGYMLSTSARLVSGTAWSDTIIWWQVGVGVALLPLAIYSWREAMRWVDQRAGRT